jgi:hypothetical protein
MDEKDLRSLIREAIQEYSKTESARREPAYQAELLEERRRREDLERRVNSLQEENRRAQQMAEQAEREAVLRTELQRLGVAKLDLAYRAVKDDVRRAEDGRLVAKGDMGDVGIREYLQRFVAENPELLPARITGGSGASAGDRAGGAGAVDLERIRPGMSAEELQRIREEVARVAQQTWRGQ